MKRTVLINFCVWCLLVLFAFNVPSASAYKHTITFVNRSGEDIIWVAGHASGEDDSAWADIFYDSTSPLRNNQQISFDYDNSTRFHDIKVMLWSTEGEIFRRCDLNSIRTLIVKKRKYNGTLYLEKVK